MNLNLFASGGTDERKQHEQSRHCRATGGKGPPRPSTARPQNGERGSASRFQSPSSRCQHAASPTASELMLLAWFSTIQ